MDIKTTKTDFYLKSSHNERGPHSVIDTIVLAIIFFHNGITTIDVAIVTALLIFVIFEFKYDKVCGLYVHEEEIKIRNKIFSHELNAHDIKCIRIFPAFYYVSRAKTRNLKDENGNQLYHMYFYSSLYEQDEMNSLEFIEQIKSFLVEKKLASCIYDKEALDYILSLNPDIKVFYPEDF